MADLAELIEQVRGVVYGARQELRPAKDRLVTAALTAAATAMEFETPAMWTRGDIAEFGADGERVELRQDHPAAGNDVNVFERGADGSTAATHVATDLILKNPRFSRKKIVDTINNAIDNDLWQEVWIWNERTVTGYDQTQQMYQLAAGDMDVARVYQYDLSSDGQIHELPTQFFEVIGQIAVGIPTGATSNQALRIVRVFDSSATVYYTAKTKPSSTDPTALPSALVEMVVLRVAASLLAEVPEERRQRQTGRSRRDEQTTDYSLMMAEFNRLRRRYHNQLLGELDMRRRYMRAPVGGAPWI